MQNLQILYRILAIALVVQFLLFIVIKYMFVTLDRENGKLQTSIKSEVESNVLLKVKLAKYQNQTIITTLMAKYMPNYSIASPTQIRNESDI